MCFGSIFIEIAYTQFVVRRKPIFYQEDIKQPIFYQEDIKRAILYLEDHSRFLTKPTFYQPFAFFTAKPCLSPSPATHPLSFTYLLPSICVCSDHYLELPISGSSCSHLSTATPLSFYTRPASACRLPTPCFCPPPTPANLLTAICLQHVWL